MNGIRATLPITDYQKQILESVTAHPVTIITAETGAGKSTQVPQYFMTDPRFNDYRIIHTQPRRLAARTVSARVAEEMDVMFGTQVGYRTAHEHRDSPDTRCLFVTDGLALVREILHGDHRPKILILDEVHEWNLNMEVLIAWVKVQLAQGADYKVVIMSATMESDKLATFFNGANVIQVPGRQFAVEDRPPSFDLITDVTDLLNEGHNVLVFQPGKAEISRTIQDLEDRHLRAVVLPLHGELTPDEQARCFRQSHLPKCVVATNVAQTSITIPDIDAVVDSGMERRVELVSGVEGLYLKPISYADAKQRKGRAGRTKPGIYIDHCDARERLEFPKPEIQRVRLDQTVLRLAEAGFNAEELEFFHQPDRKEIHEARQALIGLGLMDPRGQVTDKGRRVAKMPVGVKTACMILEAERLGVVDTILKAAAIIETGEITFKEGFGTWREHCLAERDSDALAQVMVFDAAAKMSPQQMKEDDIMVKAYRRAKEMYDHLRSSLRDKIHDLDSTGSRENALRAIAAGMVDHLYRVSGISCINGDGENRQMNNRSVVAVATWIVGLPFDLEVRNRYGGTNTLKLVRMITKVNPAWLVEIAPHLVRRETGLNPVYDPATDSMTSTTRVFFKDQVVSEVQVADPNDPTASEALTRWIVDQLNLETVPQWRPVGPAAFIQVMQANRNALGEVERLVRGTAPAMTDVQAHVMAALAGARRLGEIKDFAALAIPGLATKVEAMLKDRTPNVTIAGRNFPVRHSRDGAFAPDISVEGGMKIDGQEFWTLLPREGVLLPSGRPVVLSVSYKGMTYRGQHVPSIQDQIRCALRPEQWNEFLNQARYSFSSNVPRLPFYFFGSDPFPDLVTYQYGQDENGQPLRAYGTLVYTGESAYLHDPKFESRWFNNWEEAIRVHRAARHEYNQAHAKREQQRKLRGY